MTFILAAGLGLWGAGCSDDTSQPEPVQPAIGLAFERDLISSHHPDPEPLHVSLAAGDHDVFGLTLRVDYDRAVAMVDAGAGFVPAAGMPDVLVFLEVTTTTIHLAISRVAGSDGGALAGELGTLTILGAAPGECRFELQDDGLAIIDPAGAAIPAGDFEVEGATLAVY